MIVLRIISPRIIKYIKQKPGLPFVFTFQALLVIVIIDSIAGSTQFLFIITSVAVYALMVGATVELMIVPTEEN